jgi:RNA recognition motif-containing protein
MSLSVVPHAVEPTKRSVPVAKTTATVPSGKCFLPSRIIQFKGGGTNMKIYVGNLPYEVTEEDLQQEFAAFGEVTSVSVITDKYSGRPKGFAFIEMASKSEAEAAIAGLNGKTLKERTIMVNEARPRTDNRGGGRQRRY